MSRALFVYPDISPCSPLFSVSSVLSLCLIFEPKNLTQRTQRKEEGKESLLQSANDLCEVRFEEQI
jgi:hypothetical protein